MRLSPSGFTISEPHEVQATLGRKTLRYLNNLQSDLRTSLEYLPVGGPDQFVLDISEAAKRFEARILDEAE